MSSGMYSIGVSGLAAAQLGLLATEHNVTNANTAGYTRQRTVQATNVALNTGAGTIGQGVHVQTIERMYDQYLTAQVNSAQTVSSGLDAYYSEISQIDNLVGDSTAGLTPALQGFFSSVQDVVTNPSQLSSRQAMVSSATTLVNSFHSLDTRLSELSSEVNGKIQDTVASINTYAGQIANLNQRIILSESAYGQPANDLLDQRDQLVTELNKLIKVTTSTNSNGSFNVFVGSGQQLVVGSQTLQMTAMQSSADPSKLVVGLKTGTGAALELPEKLITGGQLGGLISFRNETLNNTANELGRVAASIALTVNAQQSLGQDLLGASSGDASFNVNFFSLTNMGPTVSANSNNAGTQTISAQILAPTYGPELNAGNFSTSLTASDYRVVFDGANYSMTRLSDNSTVALTQSGTTFSANSEGISFTLGSGSPSAGDSFLIQPTINAAKNIAVNASIAADPRTIAAAVPFATSAAGSNTGTGSISAGTTVPGFDVNLLRSNNVTITVSAGSPQQLNFSGLGVGDLLTIKLPGSAESAPVSPPVNYTNGMSIAVHGMSFTLSGQPSAGDSFTLSLNQSGVSDGRNALAMGQLQTKNTMSGANATFQGVYAEMVASVGVKANEIKVNSDAQQTVLNQAQSARDSLSGVNLDEEAANMIRFQQAYQASSKLLEIGKTLFDTLLQIG